MKMKTTRYKDDGSIQFRVARDIEQILIHEAEIRGMTLSSFIRLIIKDYLDAHYKEISNEVYKNARRFRNPV